MSEWGYSIKEKEADALRVENKELQSQLAMAIEEKDNALAYQLQDGTNSDMIESEPHNQGESLETFRDDTESPEDFFEGGE